MWEKVACRLTSPGIGAEVGSYAGSYQPFYQGLFLAPHTVAQAVKSAILAARAFEMLGFAVNPAWDAPRNDVIEAIRFDDPRPAHRLLSGNPDVFAGGCRGCARAVGYAWLSGSRHHGGGNVRLRRVPLS